MGLEKHSLEIGEHKYETTTLDAIKGKKLLIRLSNVMGRAFRSASTPMGVAGNLLADLTEADLDMFCDVFGEVSTVTGGTYSDRTPQLKGKVFMEHFAGNYGSMLKWLRWCVEVNFSSFFEELRAQLEVLQSDDSPKAG